MVSVVATNPSASGINEATPVSGPAADNGCPTPVGAPPCRTLTPTALADLEAGGTDPTPTPINPTVQAIHALRVLADLLATYGDIQPGEFVSPFVVNGRVVQGGKPVARALLRAGAVPGDWYGTGRLQRDIRLTFCGVEIDAIEAFEGFTCGHCMDTGRGTSELLDEGETVACLARGGAS